MQFRPRRTARCPCVLPPRWLLAPPSGAPLLYGSCLTPSGPAAVLISPYGLVSLLSVGYRSCRSGILQYRPHRLASLPTSQLITGPAVWLRCSIGSAVWSHALLISWLLVMPTGILQHPHTVWRHLSLLSLVPSSGCMTSCSSVSPHGLAALRPTTPLVIGPAICHLPASSSPSGLASYLISPSGLASDFSVDYCSRRLALSPTP